MDILINRNSSKLYDLFTSIFLACNSEYYYSEVENLNIVIEQDFKKLINEVIQLLGEDIKDYKKYFSASNIAYSLIDLEKIYELEDLNKYLDYVQLKNPADIQKSLLSYINSYKENHIDKIDDNQFMELMNDNDKLFNFLNDKPISYEEKWIAFSVLQDIDSFKHNFISLIRSYEPKYTKFIKNHEESFNKYADLLTKQINEHGIDSIKQMFDFSKVDKLYIIPSYFHAYTLLQTSITLTNSAYLVIGQYIDKVLQANNRENNVDRYVSIFKNLGDLNRYKFIKILSIGTKYGQEIADELNITSATVSYHSTNLLLANLLTMERVENKTYYSLNKNALKEMINFIQKDLNL